VASAEYVKRLNELPALRKEVTAFLKRIGQAETGDALTASAAEFILEGLHVENRLNRSIKQGEVTFKR
jgi:magnesium chelatase subunit I